MTKAATIEVNHRGDDEGDEGDEGDGDGECQRQDERVDSVYQSAAGAETDDDILKDSID